MAAPSWVWERDVRKCDLGECTELLAKLTHLSSNTDVGYSDEGSEQLSLRILQIAWRLVELVGQGRLF